MSDGPIIPGGLRVCDRECSTCVFRPGNLMHLRPGRLRDMVADSIRRDSFISCHKTLYGERAVCRGFFDRHARDTLGCRLGLVWPPVLINPDLREDPPNGGREDSVSPGY